MTARLTSDLGLHLAGVNANIDCGTVDLLPSYPLNVDHPLLSVNGNHLAFSALQVPMLIRELKQPCTEWKLCLVVAHCSASSCKKQASCLFKLWIPTYLVCCIPWSSY